MKYILLCFWIILMKDWLKRYLRYLLNLFGDYNWYLKFCKDWKKKSYLIVRYVDVLKVKLYFI